MIRQRGSWECNDGKLVWSTTTHPMKITTQTAGTSAARPQAPDAGPHALAADAQTAARPPSALRLVLKLIHEAGGTGIDTSAGPLFNHSVWARDRIISSFDLLPERPHVAHDTIRTLALLQGTRYTLRSEEERGRIHNELRDLRQWRAPLRLKALFGLVLAPLWGGSPRGYITYFGSDSTPLFILLVAALARIDPGILDERVTRRDGSSATIRFAVEEATRWIERHIADNGLVEVPKHNIFSLPPQIWRDSPTSNFDEHGRMANVVEPIAYLDIQAFCADALEEAASLFRHNIPLPAGPQIAERTVHDLAWSDELDDQAQAVRAAAQRTFWMEDSAFYAFAADRDAHGEPRLLRALQSDAGWLLATRFFDELPAAAKAHRVGGVVRMLFSPEMLTPVGIRCRALRHHNPSFRNYHEDVWPVDTFMIARGLRRQGFHELADELEARLANAIAALGGAWEFIVVDNAGHVVAPRADRAGPAPPGARPLASEMAPEEDIGWTATAVLRLKRDRASRARAGAALQAALRRREPWVVELSEEVLAGLHKTVAARSRSELTSASLPLSAFYLDQGTGLRRAAGVVFVQGFGRVLPLSLLSLASRSLRRFTPGGRSPGTRRRRTTVRTTPP